MRMVILLIATLIFGCSRDKAIERTEVQSTVSFYDMKAKSITGEEVDFQQFKGKMTLVVNTASECGFTPQYADLQRLYDLHGDKLTILGFPSNDFLSQEPGSDEEIAQFCKDVYAVSFPMFSKVHVKGADKHEVYKWLSDAAVNGWNSDEPSWNFCKYLIDREGNLIGFYESAVGPLSEQITKHL